MIHPQTTATGPITSSYFVDESLQQDGLRLFDQWQISPIQGRKCNIKLTRSKHIITARECLSPKIERHEIYLPYIGQEQARFQLVLQNITSSNKSHELDQHGRYLLSSLTGHPFKINGTLSLQSFVRRGDIIDLGFNRIKYLRSEDRNWQWDFLPSSALLASDLNILLEGESGVGKSFWAGKIHHESGRRGSFVHINLSSFAESLIESELFGHIKGAFTGAIRNKQGALASAEYGTLFLDELDSLPHSIQTKLLLFLDSKQYRPVGGMQNRSIDVRILFASGQSLEEMVARGEFRRDFFFRVSSGIKIKIPPLRGQSKLIAHHCANFATREEVTLSKRLIEYYQSLPWPGNVRQLLGHLTKKKITTKGPYLNYNHQDENICYQGANYTPQESNNSFRSIDEIKRNHARLVFNHFEGNMRRSCKVLGITKNTLRKMVA